MFTAAELIRSVCYGASRAVRSLLPRNRRRIERTLIMRCAFCRSSMTRRPTVEGVEGETGGSWRQDKLECASCTAVVVHDVFEKIGSMRESWRIERSPTRVTTPTSFHCPTCDASLASARPPDAQHAPATTFDAGKPARGERKTDHVCTGCDARYVLDEEVNTTWRKADDGAVIASPRPYPRSR